MCHVRVLRLKAMLTRMMRRRYDNQRMLGARRRGVNEDVSRSRQAEAIALKRAAM